MCHKICSTTITTTTTDVINNENDVDDWDMGAYTMVEVDMDKYLRNVERVMVPMSRRRQSSSSLTVKELHDYRSLVGQLAWPARQVMPQLAYNVSD